MIETLVLNVSSSLVVAVAGAVVAWLCWRIPRVDEGGGSDGSDGGSHVRDGSRPCLPGGTAGSRPAARNDLARSA